MNNEGTIVNRGMKCDQINEINLVDGIFTKMKLNHVWIRWIMFMKEINDASYQLYEWNRMMDQIEFMDQINHTNGIGCMWGKLGGYNLPIVRYIRSTFLDWFHKNFWSCGYTSPTIISNIKIKPSFALLCLSTLIRVCTFHSLDMEFSKSFPLMGMNSPSKAHTTICSILVLVLQGFYVKW